MEQKNRLWYRQPAEQWIEALPLGNGRMGAMVYGKTQEERIQIDESSFWSGAPSKENDRPGTRALMDRIRAALLEGDYEKADVLGHDFVGNKNQYGTNMPVGELKIKRLSGEAVEPDELSGGAYERSLDLETGLAAVEFGMGKYEASRECFLSNPDQCFCLKLKTFEKVDLELRFEGIGNNSAITGWDDRKASARIQGDALETLHSDGRHGVHLEGCAVIHTDGKLVFEDQTLRVDQAKDLEIFLDLETTMFLEQPELLAGKRAEAAAEKGYEACRKDHVRDVKTLFERMELSLGEEEKNELPTDVRLSDAVKGKEDLSLYALMYQYGRYLLIASSREDSLLPTHMGGIWNDNIYNNIDCTQDMHIDMNLQMQYWAAALCGLPECYQPFFRYMEEVLIPSGTRTAKVAYEAEGWTAHVVSNPWGFTSLGWAYNWGAWSLGGAWCAVMVWDYYEFTQDTEFLKTRGFSMLEGAAQFVADYVFQDEKSGYFMTGPSYSPENQFAVDGKNYFLALSNTCDVILVREVLEAYLKAREVPGVKAKAGFAERVQQVLDHLPPYQVGKAGQLQEWFHDFDEPIPNHRHTSHLLGLYPFAQIKPDINPELANAARVTIQNRCRNFEITSWGMNMLLGYYARLEDGKAGLEIIRETFRRIVRCNLASVMDDEKSMWRGTWELDGNTGFTAAMSELFVQSSQEEIRLLPALPKEWQNGFIKGICLKNAGKADICWKDGNLERAVIYPLAKGSCRIWYQGSVLECVLEPGKVLELFSDAGKLQWIGGTE